jgi:hypothetical protein
VKSMRFCQFDTPKITKDRPFSARHLMSARNNLLNLPRTRRNPTPGFAKFVTRTQNVRVFVPGQSVRVNLAGLQVKDVLFHAAVTAAVGTIIKQTSEDPPKYLVKLLFSFRGISEVEVTADRVSPN